MASEEPVPETISTVQVSVDKNAEVIPHMAEQMSLVQFDEP